MKAFLTGGTGFVGSHLAEELIRRGYEVHAMVRRDARWLAGLAVAHVRCGFGDAEVLCQALEGCQYVFHNAGLTRARTRDALFAANVGGTVALLEAVRRAAPGVRRVVVTSSQAAAGPSPVVDGFPRPVTEDDPLRPISRYGESKAEMERVLRADFSDLPLTIIRPPSVYGPREADIYTVIKTAAQWRIFPIVGPAEVPRLSLVHVRDLVRGIADAAEADAALGETYFISSEQAYSWSRLHEVIAGALGRKLLTIRVPQALVPPVGAAVETLAGLFGSYPPLNREKAREARAAWVCSPAKAMRDLGFREEVPLEVGMAETVDWYRREGWL